MQVKITTTEKYNDSQGEHIVTRVELKLIELNFGDNPNEIGEICKFPYGLNIAAKADIGYNVVRPILISNEPIEVDDKAYHPILNIIIDVIGEENQNLVYLNEKGQNDIVGWFNKCKKVVATSEQFSPKQLQAIVSGKLKDGDTVLIEVEEYD